MLSTLLPLLDLMVALKSTARAASGHKIATGTDALIATLIATRVRRACLRLRLLADCFAILVVDCFVSFLRLCCERDVCV